MRLRMSAVRPRPTASGLIIANVRCVANREILPEFDSRELSLAALFRVGLRNPLLFCAACRFWFRQHVRERLPDVGRALNGMNARAAHRLIFVRRRALAA